MVAAKRILWLGEEKNQLMIWLLIEEVKMFTVKVFDRLAAEIEKPIWKSPNEELSSILKMIPRLHQLIIEVVT